MRGVVATALAGATLLWLASPAVGLGWLAWLALVPPAACVIALSHGDAARLAVPVAYGVMLELLLVPALPFGLAAGQYGGLPTPLFVDDSPVLVVALVLVPLFAVGLWAVRFGVPWRGRSTVVACVLAPAVAWAGLDFLRVKLDPGSFWGTLFVTQHDLPPAALAALAGAPLITFAIALVGYSIAYAAIRRTRASTIVLAIALAAVSAATWAGDRLGDADGRTVAVAAVQPGEHSAADDSFPFERFHPGSYELAAGDVISDLGRLTTEAAERGAEVVAWPEAIAYVDPTQVPSARSQLVRLARRTATAIVVPYFIRAERQGEAVIVSPTGDISDPMPKQRPRWFWDEDGGNRVAPRPVEVGGLEVGTLLGVDNQDPAVARRLADAGAELFVSSTHDWRELAVEQRALSRIAASATGVPLVRADWRYGSAVIDAEGEDAAAPGTEKSRRVVVAEVRTRSGSTPYITLGDTFGWLCAGIAVAMWLTPSAAWLRRRARARAARPAPRPAPPAAPPRR